MHRIVILACFCTAAFAAQQFLIVDRVDDQTLPQLTVQGTHYGVGLAVGKAFGDRISNFVEAYSGLNDIILPYYNTTAGRKAIDSLIAANAKPFQRYMDEIRGMADGAGVPLLKLMLLNFEDEIDALTNNTGEHCTDVHVVASPSVRGFGHNEDNDPTICQYAYLVNFTIYSDADWAALQTGGAAEPESEFTSFCYAGYLPGVAYAWNSHGMVFSENAVFPYYVNVNGAGDAFLGRALYETQSLDEINHFLSTADRAYGFSWNTGSTRDGAWVANIEMAAGLSLNMIHVAGNYSHENMYRRIQTPQATSVSSVHRLAVIDRLPAVQTFTDVASVLGDTSDPQYPIYRNATAPDDCSTCSTVLFDLVNRTVKVFVTNPRLGQPLYQFALP
eukprot:TRINITY_DN1826_c0_g1_i2.p1 TRINITY_DN1826_c0_g1~~TRINITY_DN1826_c0_g1_i2.p1  ORF type:complete len:389 (+),score=138.14 TRINITY_DN1826_c0_g1_i2:732-1898(+)